MRDWAKRLAPGFRFAPSGLRLLRGIATFELAWDISAAAAEQPNRQIVEIFESEIPDFSKYKLAKPYVRWTRSCCE
ncbi:MAG TPA: hypothetical protein VNY10_19750 [Roseiarcus sp.]|jgi:hypothetical protein|nr:hypothetical protein [Roseiarcus sp.]